MPHINSLNAPEPLFLDVNFDTKLREKFFPKGISKVAMGINGLYKMSPKMAARMTMFLLSVAIRRPLNKTDKAFYAQGQKQTYRWKNKHFCTYTFGRGPKILFVHGWCSNGARWQDYIDKIVAKGYSAVVVDAPGQGNAKGFLLSIPAYIQCIKTVLEKEQNWYGIVAHSIGSIVSTIATSEVNLTQKPQKMVLMSTFSDCFALMTKYARCIGIKESVLEFTRQYIPKLYGHPLAYFSLIDHLKILGSEALLIHDKADIVVPFEEVTKITNRMPEITYFESINGGHNLKVVAVEDKVLSWI